MATLDSLQLITYEMGKNITEVRDLIGLVGVYLAGRISWKCFAKLVYGFKAYALPMFASNDKWLRSLGEWAVVTGCTRGIGLAYAKELAKRGFNLILIARNEELLKRVSNSLEEKYKVKTIKICVDLADAASFDKIERVVLAQDIGVLVNNVGISNDPSFYHLTSTDIIETMINVNIKPIALITRMVLPAMLKKNKGAIVNVSSSAVYVPATFFSVYAGTKSFTEKFTESLRLEYRKTKIAFQCLSTGLVYTKMTSKRVCRNSLCSKVDAISYASYAIKTLGYSNHTCGHWFHGLQYFIMMLMPKRILNAVCIRELEKVLVRHRSEANIHHDFDDMDYILNQD